MCASQETIHVEPGSQLDRLLESAADSEVLLEKGGVRYRLNRVETPAANDASRTRRPRSAPERVLEIIGLGESAEDSNIARHKDQYLADAADHRGI